MYSFNGDFDVSSATRSAKNISVTNKLNDHFKVSLEEQKNNLINNAESNTTTKIACSPITSINEESTNVSSCNEKTHQQDDKALHDSQDDDEARAFKSQFDEIKCATRMFENSKNNRFQGFAGRVPTPSQRRVGETGPNLFHQRSYSYSTYQQQTNRQMLKPQRSISSIKGLSLNGNAPAYSGGKFYSNSNQRPSTPYTSYGFDLFDNADDIFSPLRLQLDDSNSVNGNDDAFMRHKDIENGGGRSFNHSRFGNNGSVDEWDDSYPSTPLSNGQFTPLPLTPSSTYSNRSPYLAHQNSFLDDDELIEKAKLLEDKQRLILIQQRQLDNALAALNETESRYMLNNTTPPPMLARGNSNPGLPKNSSFGNKLTVPPPRFQTSQEPIGPPTKKSGYNTSLPITPTESISSSPTFSLFSNPPALSLNQNLMNQQQNYKQTTLSDNNSFDFNPFDEVSTPSNSPQKTKNNDDGYFSFSHASAKNNIWAENKYFSPHQESKRNFYSTNYNHLPPTVPASPASHYRPSLYSSPVSECEEETLFADEYFSWNNKRNYENNFILLL